MEKQIVFPLIIDKQRELMLNLIIQKAMENPSYVETLIEHGVSDDFISFLEAMRDGSNKMPWCNHAECRGKEVSNCEHKKQ